MLQLPKNASEKLTEVEGRLRSLREEKARARKVAEVAKAAVVAVPDGEDDNAQYQAAQEAVNAVKAIDEKIEQVHEEQLALLRTAGGPMAWSGGDGWADAARRLDLQDGQFRVDLAGGSLLQKPMAATTAQFEIGGGRVQSVRVPTVVPPQDRRFLYPAFPQQGLDVETLSIVDFRLTSEPGLTGVERDPTSTAEKAVLDIDVDVETNDIRQFAVTIDEVPVKLFDVEPALREFLGREGRYALDKALDAHVIAQIEAATPPSGSSGPMLIEQARNAVASSRALGANPTVLALNPTDAAALDLTTTGADSAYVFATRDSGSASPLWSLEIRESTTVTDPLVIDPLLAAVLYIGNASILVDPYTGMKRNVVDIRIEFEAFLHVRDVSGLWTIAS